MGKNTFKDEKHAFSLTVKEKESVQDRVKEKGRIKAEIRVEKERKRCMAKKRNRER